jgi:hypothetical protein
MAIVKPIQTEQAPPARGPAAKYQHILEEYRPHAGALLEEIMQRERGLGCTFGADPVPTALRPHFLTKGQAAHVQQVTTVILNCIEKVARFYFDHPEARDFIVLNEAERSLIDIEPNMSRTVIKSRLDGFFKGNTDLQFTEMNCDSPAGMAYCDVQEAIFRDTEPMREMRNSYKFPALNRTARLLTALVAAYRDAGNGSTAPNIAITDWREVKTNPEFVLIANEFNRRGFKTLVVDPRDFDFQRGRLFAPDGTRIDLVYRRVITREIAEKEMECQALITAARKKKVCLANPFRSKVVANKSTLAVLSDPAFKSLFTTREREVIRKSVPWTRNFAPCAVRWQGRKWDIQDLARKQRRVLVLKPADGYGGQDVHIGRDTKAKDWEAVMHRALGGNWVLQGLVEPPVEFYPVAGPRGLAYRRYNVNLNPFAFGGRFGGCISRLSITPIINVTAGGAMVPTMTVDPK